VSRGALARSVRHRSRFGRARLNGSRHARFEALLSSRVRSRDDLRSGQSPVARSVLSWAFPLWSVLQQPVGAVCARTNAVGTSPCLVRPRRPVAWLRVLARCEPWPWGLEPTVRRSEQSIEPLEPPSGGDPSAARFREALAAGRQLRSCEGPERLARAPSRRRPTPPASFDRAPPRGGARLDLGDAWISVCWWATSREVNQLLWGFAPHRSRS